MKTHIKSLLSPALLGFIVLLLTAFSQPAIAAPQKVKMVGSYMPHKISQVAQAVTAPSRIVSDDARFRIYLNNLAYDIVVESGRSSVESLSAYADLIDAYLMMMNLISSGTHDVELKKYFNLRAQMLKKIGEHVREIEAEALRIDKEINRGQLFLSIFGDAGGADFAADQATRVAFTQLDRKWGAILNKTKEDFETRMLPFITQVERRYAIKVDGAANTNLFPPDGKTPKDEINNFYLAQMTGTEDAKTYYSDDYWSRIKADLVIKSADIQTLLDQALSFDEYVPRITKVTPPRIMLQVALAAYKLMVEYKIFGFNRMAERLRFVNSISETNDAIIINLDEELTALDALEKAMRPVEAGLIGFLKGSNLILTPEGRKLAGGLAGFFNTLQVISQERRAVREYLIEHQAFLYAIALASDKALQKGDSVELPQWLIDAVKDVMR